MLEEPYLTLSQLNFTIRSVIEECLSDEWWVVAEVAEITARRQRHCYLQLVEKVDDEVVAQARATLWSSRAFLLEEFEAITGETLKSGMEVLLRVRVRFHEIYGLSLDVVNLNPIYTLGGMARQKQETLERLAREGLLDRNGSLPFPPVPQRVALVSSPTAAGLGDFVTHLDHNPNGYRFTYALFPAAVQGSEAEASLVAALQKVRERASLFDVAVILRGGGSQVDLGCFDGYALAAEIARCPLPVITGIGHEKDETVADRVAHTRAKTPTAAAELLLERVRAFETRLLGACEALVREAQRVASNRQDALNRAAYRLHVGLMQQVAACRGRLEAAARRVAEGAQGGLADRSEALKTLSVRLHYPPAQVIAREEIRRRGAERDLRLHARLTLERAGIRLSERVRDVRYLDPANVLRRGYSITRRNGRAVRDVSEVETGAVLQTQVANGTIISTVESVEAEGGRRTDSLQRGDGAVGGDSRKDRPGRGGRGRARRGGPTGGRAGADVSGAVAERAGGGGAGAAGDGGG